MRAAVCERVRAGMHATHHLELMFDERAQLPLVVGFRVGRRVQCSELRLQPVELRRARATHKRRGFLVALRDRFREPASTEARTRGDIAYRRGQHRNDLPDRALMIRRRVAIRGTDASVGCAEKTGDVRPAPRG